MKQIIDVSQLQELSPEQQEKLRAWWQPQAGGLFASMDSSVSFKSVVDVDGEGYIQDVRDWHPKSECLPILSIGQCIELIIELDGKVNFSEFDGFIMRLTENVCDELFNNVKSIL